MPFVELSKTDYPKEYLPVLANVYTVRVDGIEETRSTSGDPMWGVRLCIVRGCCSGIKYRGLCVWDNWVFSKRTEGRTKLICSCFGLDPELDRDLVPGDFLNREGQVEVRLEKAERDGVEKERNRVAFTGYLRREEEAREKARAADDNVPF